jgi:hypothetical protein
MHVNAAGLRIHHTMFDLVDLPNKFVGLDDLERILAQPIDASSVR